VNYITTESSAFDQYIKGVVLSVLLHTYQLLVLRFIYLTFYKQAVVNRTKKVCVEDLLNHSVLTIMCKLT